MARPPHLAKPSMPRSLRRRFFKLLLAAAVTSVVLVVVMRWVPPLGSALMVERKVVPGAVVRRRVEEMAQRIERDTGRKPGKKAQKELKELALLELLPMAFTKRASVGVWIAPKERLLAIDAGSAGMADDVLTLLAQALPGFSALAINTALSPATAMADWLVSGEPPAGFTIDRDCELKAADGEKPVVRYARHALDLPEIREHIAAGKRPTRLALTWTDRVSFVLTEGFQVKKLTFLEGVFEGKPGKKGEDFEADAAIATGELAPMIDELIDALGGEQVIGAPAPAAAPSTATDPAPAPAAAEVQRGAAASADGNLPPWEAAAA
ncbi:MAG: recombination-associated protein RdgC [Burkholderiales bacterium PBB5]|nr:MAG: recombination-associated protein RdgC [Burkholderiales bacterium PBB5]